MKNDHGSLFVCGADVTFKNESKFAIDPMGVFDSVDEAVARNSELHNSFGYAIYEVDSTIVSNLTRVYGMRQGSKTAGYKILSKVCHAFDHPAWSNM